MPQPKPEQAELAVCRVMYRPGRPRKEAPDSRFAMELGKVVALGLLDSMVVTTDGTPIAMPARLEHWRKPVRRAGEVTSVVVTYPAGVAPERPTYRLLDPRLLSTAILNDWWGIAEASLGALSLKLEKDRPDNWYDDGFTAAIVDTRGEQTPLVALMGVIERYVRDHPDEPRTAWDAAFHAALLGESLLGLVGGRIGISIATEPRMHQLTYGQVVVAAMSGTDHRI